MIVKFTAEKKQLWDELLDTCVFAYNTAQHESTNYTPFELMFGRKAVLPVDLDFEKKDGKRLLTEYTSKSVCLKIELFTLYIFLCLLQDDNNDAISSLTNSRQAMFQSAKQNIKVAQEKQKLQFDQRHRHVSKFAVGMKVLKRDFFRKKRKGGGMDY